jgi:hypothetical protein
VGITPSQEQVTAQLRIIIPALGTIVTAFGISQTQSNLYTQMILDSVGPISYLICGIWSLIANTRQSIIAKAAKPADANTPAPQIILPPQEAHIADALPANVTSSAVAVAKVLIIALALASLVATGSAHAQSHKLAPPAVTGDLKKDLNTDAQNLGLIPKSLVVTPTGNIAADLQTLWAKIIGAADVDLAYASKMAASAATPASAVRKQCWDAIIVVNMQANGQNLKNADGSVMAKPDPHVFTDVESLAEVVDNLSPSGPLFTACAGAAQLAKTNVLTFINAVVTGAAGLAAMPVIPGL